MLRVANFTFGDDYDTGYVELPAYACLGHYDYDVYSTIEHKTYDNEGSDGLILTDTLYKERTFTIPLSLTPYLTLNMKQTIRLFEKEFLSYIRKEGVLIFEEEDDIMYIVSIESFTIDTFYEGGTNATLTLVSHYPFGLSTTLNTVSSSYGDSTLSLTNSGTYHSFGKVTFTCDGTVGVERPKIYCIENGGVLGYNNTMPSGFSQDIVFNNFYKTLTFNERDMSAYFMPRGNFFPFEEGTSNFIISADSGLSSLKATLDYYYTYIV